MKNGVTRTEIRKISTCFRTKRHYTSYGQLIVDCDADRRMGLINGIPRFNPRNIRITAIMEIKTGITVLNDVLSCGPKNCLNKATAVIAGNVPSPNDAINKML